MIEFEQDGELGAQIKVIGVGGAGGNAVNTMIRSGLRGVDFIVANTDAQALAHNQASIKLQMGDRGLGAGADPERGRVSAQETRDRLREQSLHVRLGQAHLQPGTLPSPWRGAERVRRGLRTGFRSTCSARRNVGACRDGVDETSGRCALPGRPHSGVGGGGMWR